jgi:hypothetical protein
MSKFKLLALVAAVAVGSAAAYFALSEIRPRVAAAYWRQRIAATPEGRVEDVIGRIGDTDGAIIALVEALGSDRECVAVAAKNELLARIDGWRGLPGRDCARRVTELAETLAEQVERFNPAGQRDAADVAVRILGRPIEGSGIEKRKYLAASEKILHVGLNAKGEYERKKTAVTDHQATPLAEEATQLAKLLGAGSPESSAEAGSDQAAKPRELPDGKSTAKAAADEEDAQAAGGDSEHWSAAANRPWRLGQKPQDAPRNRASRIPDVVETAVPSGANATSGLSGGTAARQQKASLAGEDILGLMRDLNSDSDARAEAAEAELKRRGFNQKQIDLARKLFDPNPEVRKKLVRDLPGLEGVDTVPWLLELCRDADAEVRLAAITILATSSDPTVLDQVEQIAGRDGDANIRRIAERVEQQRSGRW